MLQGRLSAALDVPYLLLLVNQLGITENWPRKEEKKHLHIQTVGGQMKNLAQKNNKTTPILKIIEQKHETMLCDDAFDTAAAETGPIMSQCWRIYDSANNSRKKARIYHG